VEQLFFTRYSNRFKSCATTPECSGFYELPGAVQAVLSKSLRSIVQAELCKANQLIADHMVSGN